jgi:hypothetical protein
MQRRLHQKLHAYQMIRALSRGFLPSTEQLISILRVILASDVLNPDNPDLSSAGRQLAADCRQWIRLFIEMLREKNDGDILQEAIWQLSKSRVSLDAAGIRRQAAQAKADAEIAAGIAIIDSEKIQKLIGPADCPRSI